MIFLYALFLAILVALKMVKDFALAIFAAWFVGRHIHRGRRR